MMLSSPTFSSEHLFSLVTGVVDGILTALTLAAGRIVAPDQPIDLVLAVRIALAASLSGGFVFFVAEYAHFRAELVHAERHLNLSSAGQLVASRLGGDILRMSFGRTLIAAVGGFAGAMLPLALGALFVAISSMTIVVAVAVLGLLGIAVSRAVQGNPIYWAIALMVTGALVSVAGVFLHVA
jgi:VIT1/CCC1 family predicted Fe2+/Mn2+ transporter